MHAILISTCMLILAAIARTGPPHHSDVGCSVGFFKAPKTDQCIKAFMDKPRLWPDARNKCKSEGLVLAKPKDAVSLRKYLVETYGNWRTYSLGAQGTGTSMKWLHDGQELSSRSSLWVPGFPGRNTTDKCLQLLVSNFFFNIYPMQPYYSLGCSNTYSGTLCEYIDECPPGFEPKPTPQVACEQVAVVIQCLVDFNCVNNATCLNGTCSCLEGFQEQGAICSNVDVVDVSPRSSQTPINSTESPTTVATTNTTEITLSVDHCALPVNPANDPDADDASGPQFGSKRDSRIEYSDLPHNPRLDLKFTFDIKTSADEGIIFYGGSENHTDFISIYMKDRLLVFSYNPGAGVAIMKSGQPLNDNMWHSVIAMRENEMGSLYVDGLLEASGSSRGAAHSKYIDLK